MVAPNAVRSGTIGCRRRRPASRTVSRSRISGKQGMKIFCAAAVTALPVVALLSGPAAGQMQTPNINLLPEFQSKTPEEKEADAIKDKAYRESLRKIPDAKASNDPWGNVRSTDTPKTAAPAKAKTKTGNSAN